MAVVKRDIRERRASASYNQTRTSCTVVISPNDDAVWLGDQPLDYNSLNPIYEKTCSGLLKLGSRRPIFPELALMNNKATAIAPRDTNYVTERWGVTGTYASHSVYASGFRYCNTQISRNLDKSERVNGGKLLKFQDSGSNTHHIAMVTTPNASNGGTTQVLIFQGDDISNPENVYSANIGTISGPTGTIYGYSPITVDPTNKVIYCTGIYERGDNTTTQEVMGTSLVKMSFTTVPVDGSLTISSPTRILTSTHTGYGRFMDANPTFYAGKNNAGEDCFLTLTEQEATNSTSQTADLPNSTFVKTSKGRYFFNKYNPSNNTTTAIADLKGIEGFVGDSSQTTDVTSDHFSMHAPTHFEQSSISGETNIYYGYTCGFNASTGDLNILRMKWDKANDTFAIDVCPVSMAGSSGSIQDYITHRQIDGSKNLYTTLNSVLTKSGSDYYVSVFYTHKMDSNLVDNSDQKHRNITTFSINSSNFKNLTYHSSTSFPSLACVAQDSNCTKLLSIEADSAKYWSWSSSGFTLSATEAGTFIGVTTDTDGRIWGVSYNHPNQSSVDDDPNIVGGSTAKPWIVSLHLISADLPASASVKFQDSTITYAGSNLSKNLIVNAYDTSGNRVQKNVQLKITGNNATFSSNSSTTITTQTSTSADTTVALTITGAGFINVSASFTL